MKQIRRFSIWPLGDNGGLLFINYLLFIIQTYFSLCVSINIHVYTCKKQFTRHQDKRIMLADNCIAMHLFDLKKR